MNPLSRASWRRAFPITFALVLLTACAGAQSSPTATPAPSSSAVASSLPTASGQPVPSAAVSPAISPAASSAESLPPGTTSISLYTSVTQDTIDAVTTAFAAVRPDIHVDVFRAPTGQLDARIASEQRAGGVKGDVLWATDPLSSAGYEAQGLLQAWTPSNAGAVPAADHTQASWGTRLLNLVIVAGSGVSPQPASWTDLTNADYANGVALPDPSFAGSAFAALGYFASTPSFGMDYYRSLKANGAAQVSAIGDVITDVAQGQYKAGISLDKSVRDAVTKGSPVSLVWPAPGAISLYSPVAIFSTSTHQDAAEAFADFLLSKDGQAAISSTGWQPIRSDVPWTQSGPTVTLDWTKLYGEQQDLLAQYRQIFGGG
jgi:iron(III) transport system substrate-binding protein